MSHGVCCVDNVFCVVTRLWTETFWLDAFVDLQVEDECFFVFGEGQLSVLIVSQMLSPRIKRLIPLLP